MPTIRLELTIPGLSSSEVLELYGPALHVAIDMDSGSQSVGETVSDHYPALIDTGSRVSCIDSTLAEDLGLPVVEGMRQQVAGILGSGVVDVYRAQISIQELDLSVTGEFPGIQLAEGGQPYRVLVGRDILKSFTMTYDGKTGVVSPNTE